MHHNEAKRVRLDEISADGAAQVRASTDESVVDEYAAAIGRGEDLPPPDLFDDGSTKFIADGFHRVAAYRRRGATSILAVVHRGTKRDAVLFAVGSNAGHGLRRTNADKRNAVRKLLADAEWSRWSNREIARRCHVDEGTVRRYRDELGSEGASAEVPQMRTVSRAGTGYQQDTSDIGRGGGDPTSAAGESEDLAAADVERMRQDAVMREATREIARPLARIRTFVSKVREMKRLFVDAGKEPLFWEWLEAELDLDEESWQFYEDMMPPDWAPRPGSLLAAEMAAAEAEWGKSNEAAA